MLSLYEEMKLRGVNLDWYDKRKQAKASAPIPLEDKMCSRLSIYLLKIDGTLWTVKSNGEPYSQVRRLNKSGLRDMYVCLTCKKQWPGMPAEHRGEGDDQ
jgi:hypothetical protein